MNDDAFFEIVQQAAGCGRQDAERATRAVLETLGERIARGEAQDLAAQLPPGIAPWIATTTETAEPFDADEFLRRVAERVAGDAPLAETYTRAVFTALSRAVSPKEWADMAAELPNDFAALLARGPGAAA